MYRPTFLAALAAVCFSQAATAELFMPDLEPGSPYHLVFLTDGSRSGVSDSVTVYDEFVTADAASNPDLAGVEFRAMVTTFETDASAHADIKGPVYRLDGVMVAEDEGDMWDGEILAPINLTPSGVSGIASQVWTGSGRNGKATNCDISGGSIPCQLGAPDFDGEQFAGMSNATDRNWITGTEERWIAQFPFYGISVGLAIPVPMLTGDFDENEVVDAADIDLLQTAIREMSTEPQFDLNESGTVDVDDLTTMITEAMNTYFGDANLDLQFNSSDLVAVFTVGEYEDALPLNSTWGDGDWNGDQEFTTTDLVFAFSGGGFEQGPREPVAAVPEPSGLCLLLVSLIGLKGFRSRRHS